MYTCKDCIYYSQNILENKDGSRIIQYTCMESQPLPVGGVCTEFINKELQKELRKGIGSLIYDWENHQWLNPEFKETAKLVDEFYWNLFWHWLLLGDDTITDEED